MKLTSRQKLLLPLIILAFIIIIWQVYNLFFASSSSNDNTAAPTNATTQTAAPATTATIEKSVLTLPSTANKEQAEIFAKLMKQYQELQTKSMLLQEQVAIAETQHKIAELNAKLAALGVAAQVTNNSGEKGNTYTLMYIDQQGGQWSAVINDNGDIHKVTVGTTLPDGLHVVNITANSVILIKNHTVMRLTFSGSNINNIKLKKEPKNVAAPQPLKVTYTLKPAPKIKHRRKIHHKAKIITIAAHSSHAATPTKVEPEMAAETDTKFAKSANLTTTTTTTPTAKKTTAKPMMPVKKPAVPAEIATPKTATPAPKTERPDLVPHYPAPGATHEQTVVDAGLTKKTGSTKNGQEHAQAPLAPTYHVHPVHAFIKKHVHRIYHAIKHRATLKPTYKTTTVVKPKTATIQPKQQPVKTPPVLKPNYSLHKAPLLHKKSATPSSATVVQLIPTPPQATPTPPAQPAQTATSNDNIIKVSGEEPTIIRPSETDTKSGAKS